MVSHPFNSSRLFTLNNDLSTLLEKTAIGFVSTADIGDIGADVLVSECALEALEDWEAWISIGKDRVLMLVGSGCSSNEDILPFGNSLALESVMASVEEASAKVPEMDMGMCTESLRAAIDEMVLGGNLVEGIDDSDGWSAGNVTV